MAQKSLVNGSYRSLCTRKRKRKRKRTPSKENRRIVFWLTATVATRCKPLACRSRRNGTSKLVVTPWQWLLRRMTGITISHFIMEVFKKPLSIGHNIRCCDHLYTYPLRKSQNFASTLMTNVKQCTVFR